MNIFPIKKKERKDRKGKVEKERRTKGDFLIKQGEKRKHKMPVLCERQTPCSSASGILAIVGQEAY